MANDPNSSSADLGEIPIFARSLAYWNTLHQDGRLPARSDIRPRDIIDILPHIVLNDVIPGPPVRYRYRLVGTRVTEYYGFDPTGRMFDEVASGAFYNSVVQSFATCRETGNPQMDSVRHIWPGVQRYSLLTLPFATDGETVDIIMVVLLSNADPTHRNPMRELFVGK